MKKLLFVMVGLLITFTINAQTLLDTAVNFTVKDSYGNTLILYDILDEGKIVVIDFFSTTWGTCQAYAPDLQAAYEEFGCNDGNVFFMGIDKGNTNEDVIYFDETYGIEYPGVSGQDGGGNEVHLTYEIQATPSIVIIQPNRAIEVKQVWPPNYNNVTDSIASAGGIQQSCTTTDIDLIQVEEMLTIGPNPVKDIAYLRFNMQREREIEIHIFNLTGGKVMEFRPAIYGAGKHLIKADFTNEPGGFYFVQAVEKGKVIVTKKLILTN